ncbi:IS5/IS1182 family transposase, partial [Streptomyces varsoviensis]
MDSQTLHASDNAPKTTTGRVQATRAGAQAGIATDIPCLLIAVIAVAASRATTHRDRAGGPGRRGHPSVTKGRLTPGSRTR